jgi:hypothetical protein
VTGSSQLVGSSPPGEVFQHGEAAHEGACGGAVPVLFAGQPSHGVAGAHAQNRSVAGADETDALGDVQGLADGVGVSVGAGARGEATSATVIRDGSWPL